MTPTLKPTGVELTIEKLDAGFWKQLLTDDGPFAGIDRDQYFQTNPSSSIFVRSIGSDGAIPMMSPFWVCVCRCAALDLCCSELDGSELDGSMDFGFSECVISADF